ncbi:phosphopantetheine-binding protein [Paenibacillus sinopodophylli]|uniref:phosphopantetheine-binding protein n=1 Tax=Paenibacillus sinopodophylli TaxID=1837342 RepID=UPI0014861921|nr:phosphopantetheine-binding protein [Paenibacillus sinopodophylli]
MNLHNFIKEFEDIVMVDHGTVNLETNLDDLDDWDSLSMASLLATFEEKFDLKLDNDSLRELKTFAEIVELVKGRLQE